MKQVKREHAIKQLQEEFQKIGRGLVVIGDETRQAVILALLSENCYPGMRVGEIAEKTYLSRQAVSHHLRILKEEHIISMRQEGTKNFYYLSPKESKLSELKELVNKTDVLLHDPSRNAESVI